VLTVYIYYCFCKRIIHMLGLLTVTGFGEALAELTETRILTLGLSFAEEPT